MAAQSSPRQSPSPWRSVLSSDTEVFELRQRIDELHGANTAEVGRRRLAEAKIDAIYKALDAAELASWHFEYQGVKEPCPCSSCIAIRGIRAFVESAK